MKLQIVQFNWNRGGGSATIYLESLAPESALYPQQYFAVHVCFNTLRARELVTHPEQESIPIPGQSDTWLVVGFLWVQAVNILPELAQLNQASYRRQVVTLLANMVAIAELRELSAPVPTVIFS